ncbi:MAG: hypothetical protein JWP12_410 [Bacteroidetes bacterium]|nr:hypothetical protein [Bacteroidota bacterium]
MKTVKRILLGVITLTIVSCGNNTEQQSNQVSKEIPRQHFVDVVKKYEADMHKSMTLDPDLAVLGIKAYDDFVSHFPTDSLAPDFLFKAAEVSTAIKQYPQALMYYQTITTQYPTFKLAPESLYMQAFLMDNFLNEDDKAKPVYEQVIAKYPTLPYANDAKAAINNLGKSDEQLIKEFEAKNK